jgi:hypothetical protein
LVGLGVDDARVTPICGSSVGSPSPHLVERRALELRIG